MKSELKHSLGGETQGLSDETQGLSDETEGGREASSSEFAKAETAAEKSAGHATALDRSQGLGATKRKRTEEGSEATAREEGGQTEDVRREEEEVAGEAKGEGKREGGQGDRTERAVLSWEELKKRARAERPLQPTTLTHRAVTFDVFEPDENKPDASDEGAGGEREEGDGGGGGAGVASASEPLVPGGGVPGPPLDESASLAEIRAFIRQHQLEDKVKTGGSGRTKAAILLDLSHVWVQTARTATAPSKTT